MSQQLTFDLPVRAAQGRGDFFVSPSNAAAVQLIDGDWPGGRLVLIGPKGSLNDVMIDATPALTAALNGRR